MKPKNELSFQYKIIDLINEKSWPIVAITSTLLALLGVWGMGFLVFEKLSYSFPY